MILYIPRLQYVLKYSLLESLNHSSSYFYKTKENGLAEKTLLQWTFFATITFEIFIISF